MHPHGVHDLNRWVQRQFRAREVTMALEHRGTSLGDETIVARDKVIQTRNEWRKCYRWTNREPDKLYIANGEVGMVAPVKGNLKVLFAGRPQLTFDYWPKQFGDGHGPLELAYALTVHKAQGSEFKKVFVVVPKQCRLLSRELLYTALTRSREHLVLLVEGDDATSLFDLTRPERSETARRNTNIFDGVIREAADAVPYAEHLIHRTDKGHMVRSKSELVIANMLYLLGIPYEYERVYEGTAVPGRLRPDFSFVTPDGDVIIWEHLGMMDRESYRRGWDWKRDWYERNGFIVGQSLFTSEETAGAGIGLDTAALRAIAMQIKPLLRGLEGDGPPGAHSGHVRRPPVKHTILFLAANPIGTDPRALDREAHAIHVELERSGFRHCFELVTRWAAEPLDLLRELRKLKPTVVHFSGHSGQNAASEHQPGQAPHLEVVYELGLQGGEQQHGLFFQGPDGRAQVVSTAALEETFGAAGASVKLVVLNACYTAAQAEALLAHVGCVVGMGGSIHDGAARNFAIGFYGGLGERESVEAAYKQGRAAISLEGLRDSERPQLKVRTGVDATRLVLAGDPQ